jgi:hypothetical protein
VEALPRLTVSSGPNTTRRYWVFKLADRHQPLAPSGDCPD